MELFKRDEAIEKLLWRLDIPRTMYPYEQNKGIGPYDPDFFVKYQAHRRERERIAEDSLRAMADEDLWQLCETPDCIDIFAMEYSLFDAPPWYAGGFGVSVYKPDYEHWARMEYWTLEEATCLSLGFKPEKMPGYQSDLPSPYEALDFLKNRLSLIKRAPITRRADTSEISPATFVGWAESKSLEIPSELIKAIHAGETSERPKMLSSVDRRQYDSALKVILGLLSFHEGYKGGAITSEIKKGVASGLAELGLNLDRKTLVKALGEAVKSRKSFVEDQQKRDENGD